MQAFRLFWTPLHPYHTVGPVSRHFPAFERRRTLITPLNPNPGVSPFFGRLCTLITPLILSLTASPLLDANAPLSHR
ncbi:hypothetical protein Y032_0089g2237 [Ancylostoma ceylanicum]|uniref:Uncharacterized protein n=1 Tax=Ancylostoma ceylanicum TaxID=53326 RepID=A0A016TNA6_9BILA|nr:hypothetical protein Y032_0089g2237 [Ancylostoma ceylanicum]